MSSTISSMIKLCTYTCTHTHTQTNVKRGKVLKGYMQIKDRENGL